MDGKFAATGGEDGTVRVWAPKTGQCRHVFESHFGHHDAVSCMASSPDGDSLLSGGLDGRVLLLQISGKRLLKEFAKSTPDTSKGDEEVVDSVECVGFSQSREFNWAASGGSSKELHVWDIVSGNCRASCVHGGSVVALKWHSSLPLITTAALDNLVRVWDARSGSCVLELSGHSDLVTNIDMKTITIAEHEACESDPSLPPLPPDSNSTTEKRTKNEVDVIVAVSDDHTSRVFHFVAGDFQAGGEATPTKLT